MATINRFEDIEVWHLARQLSIEIWTISHKGTFSEDTGLKRQINRAAGFIMDNIAEGFGQEGNKEFINFLGYGRGSNDEVRSQLYRAVDRNHIAPKEFDHLQKFKK